MKRYLSAAFLAVIALVFTDSSLQAAAPAGPWTVTSTFVSQYMFRGVRLGGASFQPSVEYNQGSMTGGLWASFPFKEMKAQSTPEYDLYFSDKFSLNESLTLIPGVTGYIYPRAEGALGYYRYTVEPYLAAAYTVSGITLTPKLYYDFYLKGPTAELMAAYSVPVAGRTLDLSAGYGTYKWDDAVEDRPAGAKIKNYGNYGQVGVSSAFEVNTGAKLVLGVSYTWGQSNYFKTPGTARVSNPNALARLMGTVAYSFQF